MAKQTITLSPAASADNLYDAFDKVNDNNDELYAATDIDAATELTTVDDDVDAVMAYDDSAAALRKVKMKNLAAGRMPQGSESAPGLRFVGDDNTGIYYVSADKIGISTGGTKRIDIDDDQTEFTTPIQLPSYTIATLPTSGIGAGAMAYVTDDIGGAVPTFYDGSTWRRVTDRAAVSVS